MFRCILVTLLSFGLAISTPAVAAVQCTGTVNNVFTYANGQVMILGSWAGGWTMICDVKQSWKGVPPETCYLWYSQVSNALTENKNLSITYDDPSVTACGSIPTYSGAPAPVYIYISK